MSSVFYTPGRHFHNESPQKPYEVGAIIIILILQIWKPRFREVNSLGQQVHTVRKWWNQDKLDSI